MTQRQRHGRCRVSHWTSHLVLQFRNGLQEQRSELLQTIEKAETEIRDFAGPLLSTRSCFTASKESLFARAHTALSRPVLSLKPKTSKRDGVEHSSRDVRLWQADCHRANAADLSQPADPKSGTSLAVTVGENSESIELYHERQRTRFRPSTHVLLQRSEFVKFLSDLVTV